MPTRLALLGWALLLSPGTIAAQRIEAPTRALMDEVVDVRVHGLRPGERATLRAAMTDSAGRRWSAEALFRADADGEIRLGRDVPVSGSYAGVEAMGLISSMSLLGEPDAVFIPPNLLRVPVTFTLLRGDHPIDSATVVRAFLTDDVRVIPLDRPGGPIGTLFLPAGSGRRPGILVLGGSDGGNSAVHEAAQLASRGFVTLSLAYFGAASLPRELDEIPLDYFINAISFLRSHPRVDSTALAILGTSKGAEAALLVAAQDPRVRAVIAYAPSSVSWSCICSTPAHSSWSYGGAPLPAVPPGRDPSVTAVPGQPLRPALHYRYRLRDADAVARALIPVERIAGPIMLVAGDADDLWPSGEMARQVMARRGVAPHRGDVLLIYSGAGHRIGKTYLPAGSTRVARGRLETGGTAYANAAAQRDAWPRVLEFLSTVFGSPGHGR